VFRWGVVGLGLGRGHAERILRHGDGWALAAVCDALPERTGAFGAAHPDVRVSTDYARFLEDAVLDGVILAVPHDLHMPLAIQALDSGRHVLVEKPMARTVAECAAMNAAARRAGKVLMVAQNWRYTPWVRLVKRLIATGELGRLRAARSEWLQRVLGDSRPGNWLADGARAGGGPVMSLAVHNIDCMRYLLGEPARVTAVCHWDHPAFRNGAEIWAMAQVEFEQGAMGQVFTSYAAYAPVDGGPLWLYGDEGTLYKADLASADVRVSTSGRPDGYATLEDRDHGGLPSADAYLNELHHFVDCCRTGSPPLSGGEDNVRTIRFVEAIYESARRGMPVTLERVDESREPGSARETRA